VIIVQLVVITHKLVQLSTLIACLVELDTIMTRQDSKIANLAWLVHIQHKLLELLVQIVLLDNIRSRKLNNRVKIALRAIKLSPMDTQVVQIASQVSIRLGQVNPSAMHVKLVGTLMYMRCIAQIAQKVIMLALITQVVALAVHLQVLGGLTYILLLLGYEVEARLQISEKRKIHHVIHILHGTRATKTPSIGGLLQIMNTDLTARISWLKIEAVVCGLEDNAGQEQQAAAKVGQITMVTLILTFGLHNLQLVLITGATRVEQCCTTHKVLQLDGMGKVKQSTLEYLGSGNLRNGSSTHPV